MEIKRTVSATCLNHLETLPLQSTERLSSTDSVPDARRLGTTAVHPLVEAFQTVLRVASLVKVKLDPVTLYQESSQ